MLPRIPSSDQSRPTSRPSSRPSSRTDRSLINLFTVPSAVSTSAGTSSITAATAIDGTVITSIASGTAARQRLYKKHTSLPTERSPLLFAKTSAVAASAPATALASRTSTLQAQSSLAASNAANWKLGGWFRRQCAIDLPMSQFGSASNRSERMASVSPLSRSPSPGSTSAYRPSFTIKRSNSPILPTSTTTTTTAPDAIVTNISTIMSPNKDGGLTQPLISSVCSTLSDSSAMPSGFRFGDQVLASFAGLKRSMPAIILTPHNSLEERCSRLLSLDQQPLLRDLMLQAQSQPTTVEPTTITTTAHSVSSHSHHSHHPHHIHYSSASPLQPHLHSLPLVDSTLPPDQRSKQQQWLVGAQQQQQISTGSSAQSNHSAPAHLLSSSSCSTLSHTVIRPTVSATVAVGQLRDLRSLQQNAPLPGLLSSVYFSSPPIASTSATDCRTQPTDRSLKTSDTIYGGSCSDIVQRKRRNSLFELKESAKRKFSLIPKVSLDNWPIFFYLPN